MQLTTDQLDFFRRHGYVVLGQLLAAAELQAAQDLFDRDRRQHDWAWRPFGHHQTINCDALVTSPAIDSVIRHPRVLPSLEQLLGGPACFSEICIRHMAPYDGETRHGWHRDRPHLETHPLRIDYLQLMLYLTDVDESTHCFSLSPEAADAAILERDAQLARGGIVDLHGPAGTAAIFNISVLHTATVRPTAAERKTIQIYYGHRDRPYLSNDSVVPASLWAASADAETRAFYGNLNPRTRQFSAAFSEH